MVDQSAEGHAIVPAAGEVSDLYVLKRGSNDIRHRNNDAKIVWFNISAVSVYNVKLSCKIGISYSLLKLCVSMIYIYIVLVIISD